MDAEEIIELFDSYWFGLEILKKQPNLSSSSGSEPNPDHPIQERPSKPEISRIPTLHKRSMSDQLSSKASFNCGSLSPAEIRLQTILSGKEVTEPEETKSMDFEAPSKRKVRSRRRQIGETKSLSELEFEELKGFIDLGFVFSEEDRDSSLAAILPGLHRLGKSDGEDEAVHESVTSRPYLSEAWELLDGRKTENPLMNWKIPALSNAMDMKDNIKWWAHTVASAVR